MGIGTTRTMSKKTTVMMTREATKAISRKANISAKDDDFFLWGHVKSIVYREPIENRAGLERRILEALQTVTPEMLRRCSANFLRRARLCVEMGGGHFEHLL